jgi:hypothetical protein
VIAVLSAGLFDLAGVARFINALPLCGDRRISDNGLVFSASSFLFIGIVRNNVGSFLGSTAWDFGVRMV